MKAAKALHNYTAGHDKFYVCRVDHVGGGPTPYRVVAGWGAAARPKAQAEQGKADCGTFAQALMIRDRLLAEKRKGGYVDVETSGYRGGLTKDRLLSKVDMTRCCNDDGTIGPGYSTAPAPMASPTRPPPSSKPPPPGKARKIIRGLGKKK